MKTDITLETEDRMLIIDAKFYDHILNQNRFAGSRIIDMGNIYQINTYVENQLQQTGKDVKGMLLYAQTIDEPVINIKVPINNKDIMIRTLDLNQDWKDISGALDQIAISFINNTI
jgi:5-methylcytosine-specific restriction enzyme subunit McrC